MHASTESPNTETARRRSLYSLVCSIGALPVLTLTRPIPTMHTAKTQTFPQPQRNRFLLRPKPYYRHYGPAAWIDPVVLRAITISWNNIRIPVRPFHGHPDDKPHPWFTINFGIPRIGCDTKRPQATQHHSRTESERYGHYPHALASLPQSQFNEHLVMIVPAARG